MSDSQRLVRRAVVGVGLASAVLGVLMVACASAPDDKRITQVLAPDFEIYKANVDGFLTRRCGSLDCHGQPGRAYRIYSQPGFRLPDGKDDKGDALVSGSDQPGTPEELRANFQAIVGLEPEEMTRVVAAQGDEESIARLLFIRKALNEERHKGGPAMTKSDPGYTCVRGWLRVPVVSGPAGTPTDPGQRRLTRDEVEKCDAAAQLP